MFMIGLLMVAALLGVPTAASAADVGVLGPSTSGASAPTGQKPESKLWFHAGHWWGVLYDSSTSRFTIWRFNWASDTWTNTGVVVDSRRQTSSDALSNGSTLFIASHVKEGSSNADMAAKVMRFTYVPATDTYQLDTGFPLTLTTGAVETMVIDQDSLGRIWGTWTESNGAGGRQVMVTRSLPGGTDFITPFVLPMPGAANLASDDVSTLVSYEQADGVGKIGVLWSNQNDSAVNFAFHADGAADGTWTLNQAVQGPGYADDHINLKGLRADALGNIYAVVKTSLNDTGGNEAQPLILVLILDNTGSWKRRTFSTVQYNQTRPILLVDNENRQMYVFAATPCCSGGIIHYKSADLDNPNFIDGVGTPFMEQATSTTINNPTSTKQPINSSTDLLVIAADDHSKRYVFNKIDIAPSGPDLTPPDTTISSGPTGTVTATTATFGFTATEAGSTFTCTLDSGPATACTSGVTYSSLTEGPHTFTVTATDAANNTDLTPATRTWTVDTTDDTPPDTTITSGPTGTVSTTTATFEFTATEAGSTFACTLGGGAPTPCTTGVTYTNLPDGPHTFTVTATDPANNTDLTPATRTWTVDTTSLGTIVRQTVNTRVATTASTLATVAAPAGTSTDDVLVACLVLNGSTVSTPPAGWTRFAALTTISNPHVFGYYRVAGASEPASYTWTLAKSVAHSVGVARYSGVDPASPIDGSASAAGGSATSGNVPAITTTTPDTMLTGCMGINTGSTGVNITPPAGMGEVWDIGGKRQEYADAIQAATGSTGAKAWTFTSSRAWAGWTLALRPGASGPDLTPPDTTITSGPSGTVDATTATFGFTATETGSSFSCTLDGSAYTPCTSGVTYTNLADGAHTFTVTATDAANNTDPTPATRTWTVDTTDITPPDTTITSGPTGTVSTATATFDFTATEAGSTFACTLDGNAPTPCTTGVTYADLTEGSHTFTVTATDAANNTDPTPATRTWTINTTPSAGIVRQTTSTTVATTASNLATVSTPAGTAANDVLVACVTLNGANVSAAPAGWTQFAATTGVTNPRVFGYYRVVGASEPASYTWNLTSSVAHSVGIARYSGVDPASPIDGSASAAGASATSGSIPAITTTAPNAMITGCMGVNSGSTTIDIAPPSGMGEVWDIGGKRQEYADAIQAAAGSTGIKTWTFTSSREWAGWTLALRPS
jgi:hypothetical protein